ncbi:MAG: 30S ribosomal protein S20 [Clostridium sp.]|nr:30S ribosomal protein S20 [Clostridium sp.]
MPNIKNAIKRVKTAKSKTLRNNIKRSSMRTNIKKFNEAVANNDTNAENLLKNAVKSLDKSAAKNIIHKNTAARRKSKLAKALNSMAQ